MSSYCSFECVSVVRRTCACQNWAVCVVSLVCPSARRFIVCHCRAVIGLTRVLARSFVVAYVVCYIQCYIQEPQQLYSMHSNRCAVRCHGFSLYSAQGRVNCVSFHTHSDYIQLAMHVCFHLQCLTRPASIFMGLWCSPLCLLIVFIAMCRYRCLNVYVSVVYSTFFVVSMRQVLP